jgi:RNA polymerase sigma-70 factor, ECF subfamily
LATDDTRSADLRITDGASDFAAVVEVHWSSVYRLLHSLTGNTHDAEELTQETFLRALRRRDSFRPGTNLRSWLLRIATNAGLDMLRKQKRARRRDLPDEMPDRAEWPGHRLEVAEQGVLIRAAMEELSETTRAVFHLRVQESLPFREIAELVHTTEQAARWHMHQARSKLMKHLPRPD